MYNTTIMAQVLMNEGHAVTDNFYFFEPPLDGDSVLDLARIAQERGSSMSQAGLPWLLIRAQELIQERGVSAILRLQPLTEAVLPDGTPRDQLLETIKIQLNRCNPTTSLLIVDPYIFPNNPDSRYLRDLLYLVEPAVTSGIDLQIATKSNRNTSLESAFQNGVASLRRGAGIHTKYADVFHDRFWIADEERGLFIGTSLNGIGRRYSVTDYLQEADAREISARYNALPS